MSTVVNSFLVRFLCSHADDLELVGMQLRFGAIQRKLDIFEEKGPDLVAEAIRIQVALKQGNEPGSATTPNLSFQLRPERTNLEIQFCVDLIGNYFLCNGVEVAKYAYRQLWLDVTFVDQVIDRVHQGGSNADGFPTLANWAMQTIWRWGQQRHDCNPQLQQETSRS